MNIQQLINTLTQSTDIPLLTAFILGLLTALNPCQLAISTSALAYISRQHPDGTMRHSLLYTLGRTITYIILALTLMCLIGGSKNLKGYTPVFEFVERAVPYILIVIGIYLLSRAFHHHHHHGESCHNSGNLIRRNGPLGSIILGMTLALAFCPESAIFYFGIMLPLSLSSTVGILIPLTFAIGASLPILLIAWLMHRAIHHASQFTHSLEHFQQVLNAICGILFILIALMLF